LYSPSDISPLIDFITDEMNGLVARIGKDGNAVQRAKLHRMKLTLDFLKWAQAALDRKRSAA